MAEGEARVCDLLLRLLQFLRQREAALADVDAERVTADATRDVPSQLSLSTLHGLLENVAAEAEMCR